MNSRTNALVLKALSCLAVGAAILATPSIVPGQTVTPSTKEVGPGLTTYATSISSTAEWSVQNIPSWISVTPSSGAAAACVEMSVQANSSSIDRVATLQVGASTQIVTQRGAGTPVYELMGVGDDAYGELGANRLLGRSQPAQIATSVTSIAASGDHGLFLKSDGTVWAMGDNSSGQIGDGLMSNRSTPVQVASGVASISAGVAHTLLVKTDGTLWATGSNASGRFGDGTTISRSMPVQVGSNIASSSAGYAHSLILKTDGTLWAAGFNYYGQLGDGTTTNRSAPVQIASAVASVSAGGSHSLFVKTDGTLWAVGYNNYGQLGDGTTTNRSTPVQVASGVASVAGGDSHTLFLKTDGTLWAMGQNYNGELGDNSTTNRSVPVQVATGVSVIGAGAQFSMFVKTDGTAWAMGVNSQGQLGDGTMIQRAKPVQVATGVSAVATGYSHSLLRKTDGTLWVIGDNRKGQLGDGSVLSRTRPLQVVTSVTSAAAGEGYSLYLSSDATLWAMGNNDSGQLGDGGIQLRSTPVQVASNVLSAVAGYSHSLVLKKDRTLWAMGENLYGQLGDGTTSSRRVPVQVATDVVAMSAGRASYSAHSLFLKTDGTLWAMGYNSYGQLGDGTSTNRRSPVQVASGVVAAVAGESHSIFLKADGTVWAMGYNGYGQLGDGTTTTRRTPVQVASAVAAIAAGYSHSLFLKTDGTLWAVGRNSMGQLGDGKTISRSTAVQIASDVTAVAGGANHTVFLKKDWTLWAMGLNTSGQLGDSSTATRTSPVQIGSRVVYAAAGGTHSLFIRESSTASIPHLAQSPFDQSIHSGSPALFQVVTRGSLALTFQWQGKAAGSSVWTSLSDDATYSGTATAGLSIANVTVGLDGYAYRCIVSDSGTIETSEAATLTIPSAPTILTAPLTQSITAGENVSFTVSASGAPKPFTYQWQSAAKGSANWANVTGVVYAGATTETLTIAGASVGLDGTQFRCVVANSEGSSTSGIATLLVSAITITQQPGSVTIPSGTTTSLSVTVKGAAPLTYQWYQGASGSTATPIFGANSANYTTVATSISRSYWVRVTNSAGSIDSNRALVSIVVDPMLPLATVTTFAGGGPYDGSYDGSGTDAYFSHISGLAKDEAGNFYATDSGFLNVRKITPLGVVTTLAGDPSGNHVGSVDGKGSAAMFFMPSSLTVDTAGNIYVTDAGNLSSYSATGRSSGRNIRKITQEGVVTTIAGEGHYGWVDGPAASAEFRYTDGICIDALGNLYVCDGGSIRKITPAGAVTTVAWSKGGISHSTGVAGGFTGAVEAVFGPNGNLYFSDSQNEIWTMTPAGEATLIAGATTAGWVDGVGTEARFSGPSGLAFDGAGNLFVTEIGNRRIRMITPAGRVTTIAGNGSIYTHDGTGEEVGFASPNCLQFDGSGNLIVADNGTLRKVTIGAEPSVAPKFVQQPSDETTRPSGNAIYTVVVTGKPTPALMWQQSKDGGNNWRDVVETTAYTTGPTFTGTATANLFLENITTAMSGWRFRCIAINGVGAPAVSDEAVLTTSSASLAPVLSAPPVGGVALVDGAWELKVEVAGSGLLYQWMKDGVAIAGATGKAYRLTRVSTGDAGNYTCVVTSSYGNLTTSPVALAVSPVAVAPATKEVGPGRVIYPVAVASNAPWTASTTASWVTLSKTTGDFRENLDIEVQPNPDPVERTATIFFGGQAHTVKQRASTSAAAELWVVGDNHEGQLGDRQWLQPIRISTAVSKVAAGSDHSLFIKSDGTLWGVGSNSASQLGAGLADFSTPIQLASDVVQASAGYMHTLYIKSDGSLWGLGRNLYGAIGDGTTTTHGAATQIATDVVAAAAGTDYTLFVKKDGTLWGTGSNSSGQLGDGTKTQRLVPVQIADGVKNVAAGTGYSLFIKTDGTLWGMGASIALTPVQVASDVVTFAVGSQHRMYVKTDGTLWAWGNNTEGQFGDGTITPRNSPVQVATGIARISTGDFHSLMLKADGSLWGTGQNADLQIDAASPASFLSPVHMANDVVEIAAGGKHTLFIRSDGTLWGMGANLSGQLSDTAVFRTVPAQVDIDVASVSAGWLHSQYLKEDGSFWVMGDQYYAGSTWALSNAPVQVAEGVRSTASGASHILFIRNDGSLWGAGDDTNGQLGLSHINSSTPLSNPGLIAWDVTGIAGGGTQSYFIKSDGALWAMGHNWAGALGDGTTSDRYEPVHISDHVTNVASAASYSLFIKSDHTVWASGYNLYGVLGNGDYFIGDEVHTPLQVGSDAVSVTAGYWHSLYLKSDGTLWGTGSNGEGQLGLGAVSGTSGHFVLIATDVTQVVAGGMHTLFVKKDGTLWATGANDAGQLGDGTTTQRNTPVKIASGVIAIGAGRAQSLFVKVAAELPPVFKLQPSNQATVVDRAAAFEVTATGAPSNFNYQWQRLAAGSETWTSLSDGPRLSGATTASLSVTPSGTAENGDKYRCVVSNGVAPDATSVAATLSVGKGNATVALSGTDQTYTGGAISVSTSTVPVGLAVVVLYDGKATPPANVGSYVVSATIDDLNYQGSATGTLNIRPTLTLGQSATVTGTAGQGISFSVVVAAGGAAVTYQWQRQNANGTWSDIPGATSASYSIPSTQSFHAGQYRLIATAGGVTATSEVVSISVAPAPASKARLMNLSTRALDLTGDNILIPGFVLTGSGTKKLLIRAIGPTLGVFGVSGILEDPRMTIMDAMGSIGSNDNWGTNANKDALVAATSSVGAFQLVEGSKDAALLVDLAPGAYTVPTSGAADGTGVALVELYDADTDASTASMVNISNRGYVGVGDNIMIPGIYISKEGSRTFLIRAVGPGLKQFGLDGVLEDPVLTVFSGKVAILTNDNWGEGSENTATMAPQVGAFALPKDSKDAAFVVTLPPGAYTIQASGKDASTGIALVEVYLVPQPF